MNNNGIIGNFINYCKGLMKAVDPRNLEILHFTKLILPFIDFSDECHEGNGFELSYRNEIIP